MRLDIVCPNNNETELALLAKSLGFKEIIFLYSDFSVKKNEIAVPGLRTSRGFFVKSVNEISSARRNFDLIFAPAERAFFESKNVDFVVGWVDDPAPDYFYQRRAGIDDAMCKLADENNVGIVFPLDFVDDKKVLGRLGQNALLCRRHKLDAVVASFARTSLDMKTPRDLDAFARVIRLF
jgi:hypothetical protein